MSGLGAAAERLERAMARLEAVAGRPRPAVAEAANDERLVQELARAKADIQQLETVTDGVANRLDGAIRRLEAALG